MCACAARYGGVGLVGALFEHHVVAPHDALLAVGQLRQAPDVDARLLQRVLSGTALPRTTTNRPAWQAACGSGAGAAGGAEPRRGGASSRMAYSISKTLGAFLGRLHLHREARGNSHPAAFSAFAYVALQAPSCPNAV